MNITKKLAKIYTTANVNVQYVLLIGFMNGFTWLGLTYMIYQNLVNDIPIDRTYTILTLIFALFSFNRIIDFQRTSNMIKRDMEQLVAQLVSYDKNSELEKSYRAGLDEIAFFCDFNILVLKLYQLIALLIMLGTLYFAI